MTCFSAEFAEVVQMIAERNEHKAKTALLIHDFQGTINDLFSGIKKGEKKV